jgi:hypothetical protein
VKLTVLCDLNGEIRYLSPLVGAAKSDIEHIRDQLSVLNTLLSPEDEIVLDKAYESIDKDMANIVVHVKHKKPRCGFLCEEEKVKNREMEKIRPKIESVFERPKNCFKILREKFRMRVKKW